MLHNIHIALVLFHVCTYIHVFGFTQVNITPHYTQMSAHVVYGKLGWTKHKHSSRISTFHTLSFTRFKTYIYIEHAIGMYLHHILLHKMPILFLSKSTACTWMKHQSKKVTVSKGKTLERLNKNYLTQYHCDNIISI